MVKKRASKDDEWKGMIGERVDNLVKAVDELKITTEKGFEKVDEKFVELGGCVNSKFDKHNTHHTNVEKKYIRYFLILGALTVGSFISNPEYAYFAWSLIVKFIGVF